MVVVVPTLYFSVPCGTIKLAYLIFSVYVNIASRITLYHSLVTKVSASASALQPMDLGLSLGDKNLASTSTDVTQCYNVYICGCPGSTVSTVVMLSHN